MKTVQIIPALFLLGLFSAGHVWAETKIRGDVSIHFDSPRPHHRPMYRHPPHRPPMVVHRPMVYKRPPAVVYVEQPFIIEQVPVLPPPVPSVAKPQVEYWFYCAQSQAYYPYVNACPAGWMKVVPQTPG